MITAIETALNTPEARLRNWRMSMDSWKADQDKRAERVAYFRRYADGEHDADMTPEMQDMLRITQGDANRFNDNYMDLVIQTENDRLKIERFETDNPAADQWIRDLLDVNRFDGTQGDVHEGALTDADTYALVHWDNDEKYAKITHEPAYDGKKGMLSVLAPDNSVQIAIKVWHESRESIGDTTIIAVYYSDRVVTYVSSSGSALTQASDEQYNLVDSEELGQPVIHFPNRGRTDSGYGKSELEDAIPLQDALNRTLHSMVSTGELTGFPIRYILGFDAGLSRGLTPGMIIELTSNLADDAKIMIGTMEQGEIVPYIQQAEWLTTEIGRITRTPAPEFMGSSSASGEAIKQREIGLLGKVNRFQVKAGNKWEDVIRMAWRVQAANGDKPPEFTTIKTIWADPEIRNESDMIANAKILHDLGYEQEALRQMAGVFGWDAKKIEDLMSERQATENQTFERFAGNGNIPNFSNALTGVNN
jgi:hypothetical protein